MGIDDKPKSQNAAKHSDETPRILGEAKPFDNTPSTTTFNASDGSPVSVQYDSGGKIVSASGTGVDGVKRKFWTQGQTQFYQEGTLEPLVYSTEISPDGSSVSLTLELSSIRSTYFIEGSSAQNASDPSSPVFQIIGTVFSNNVQKQQFSRIVGATDLQPDLNSYFQGTLGKGAMTPMVYFARVLASAFVASRGNPPVGCPRHASPCRCDDVQPVCPRHSPFCPPVIAPNIDKGQAVQPHGINDIPIDVAKWAVKWLICTGVGLLDLGPWSAPVCGIALVVGGDVWDSSDGLEAVITTTPIGMGTNLPVYDGPPSSCTCEIYEAPPCICETYEAPPCTCETYVPPPCSCDGYQQQCACEGYQPPVCSCESYQPPVCSCESYQPPVCSCEGYQPPVCSCEGYQPPVCSCEGYQGAPGGGPGCIENFCGVVNQEPD